MIKDLDYYRKKDKELKAYHKKYYNDNKESHSKYYKERVTCVVCKCTFQRSNKTHHITSNKHLRNLAKQGKEDEVNIILEKYKLIEE